mmetsp:Transcript_92009/g.231349  ORF Transcript_92009/g.231349 Transcript_92009/m.231349 type:complete len:287 (-) Transcript_92009:2426-3286(-)
MQQVECVVDRQTHDGNEEDALVLAKAPTKHRDEAQEHDADPSDVRHAQQRYPPIRCCEDHHEKSHHEGENNAHCRRSHHLVLRDHEEVELGGLNAADVWRVQGVKAFPAVVPLVCFDNGILDRIRGVEAYPCKCQRVASSIQVEACVHSFHGDVRAAACRLQDRNTLFLVGFVLVAAEVRDEVGRGEAEVVVLSYRGVADSECRVPQASQRGACQFGRHASASLSLDLISPEPRKFLHEAIATWCAIYVLWDVDACLLQYGLVWGAPSCQSGSQNETFPPRAASGR